MPKTSLIAITCVLACVAGHLRAQTTPPPVPPDLEELRKAYQDDENERKPAGPPLQRPNVTHHETIRPSRLIWTCVGTWPGQPIYSEPDVNSKPIGMTTWAAAAGNDVASFVRVLMVSGATGYIPASSIHEYAKPDHPGVACTFSGLNMYGGAVLAYHEPSKR